MTEGSLAVTGLKSFKFKIYNLYIIIQGELQGHNTCVFYKIWLLLVSLLIIIKIVNNSKFLYFKLFKKELTFSVKPFSDYLKKYLQAKWSLLSEHIILYVIYM